MLEDVTVFIKLLQSKTKYTQYRVSSYISLHSSSLILDQDSNDANSYPLRLFITQSVLPTRSAYQTTRNSNALLTHSERVNSGKRERNRTKQGCRAGRHNYRFLPLTARNQHEKYGQQELGHGFGAKDVGEE